MRVLLVAFAALGVGAAKRKKAPLQQPDEMCSACWAVAVQARRALGFYVRRDRAPNAAEWKRAMVSGCPATAGIRERCEADLVGRYGEDLAFVLEDLYDEAEGDERFLNLGEVSAKLEIPEGMTCNDGLEIKVAFHGVWKQSLTELSGGQKSRVVLCAIMWAQPTFHAPSSSPSLKPGGPRTITIPV